MFDFFYVDLKEKDDGRCVFFVAIAALLREW